MAPRQRKIQTAEYSARLAQRQAQSHRTGQACDRCKSRKMKCDSQLETCENCKKAGVECSELDRNTGQSRRRGYVEKMERRVEQQTDIIKKYEDLMGAAGLNPKDLVGFVSDQPVDMPVAPSTPTPIAPVQSTSTSNPDVGPLASIEINYTEAHFVNPSPGATLPPLSGMSLSVLGENIDLAQLFSSPIHDEPADEGMSAQSTPVYNLSAGSYLRSIAHLNGSVDAQFPGQDDGDQEWAHWYLDNIHPYYPVLHGPTLLDSVNRLYSGAQGTSLLNQIILHLVTALWSFDRQARNPQVPEVEVEWLRSMSTAHYHLALAYWHQLEMSSSLPALQVMALICIYLNNAANPHLASRVTRVVLQRAIALDYHRSSNRQDAHLGVLELEMRKRVFWTVLALDVRLSSRIGLPMPLRRADIAAELPLAVDDQQLSANGIDTSQAGTCAFGVALEIFKLVPLWIDLFATMYTPLRNPEPAFYGETVVRLGRQLEGWRAAWPELVQRPMAEDNAGQAALAHLLILQHEFILLLRHPATAVTNENRIIRDNFRECIGAAKVMLTQSEKIDQLGRLDTAWSSAAGIISAAATQIYCQWYGPLTVTKLKPLRRDVERWLGLIDRMSRLMGMHASLPSRHDPMVGNVLTRTIGGGDRLRERIEPFFEDALRNMESRQTSKSLSPNPAGFQGQAGNSGDERKTSNPLSSPGSGTRRSSGVHTPPGEPYPTRRVTKRRSPRTQGSRRKSHQSQAPSRRASGDSQATTPPEPTYGPIDHTSITEAASYDPFGIPHTYPDPRAVHEASMRGLPTTMAFAMPFPSYQLNGSAYTAPTQPWEYSGEVFNDLEWSHCNQHQSTDWVQGGVQPSGSLESPAGQLQENTMQDHHPVARAYEPSRSSQIDNSQIDPVLLGRSVDQSANRMPSSRQIDRSQIDPVLLAQSDSQVMPAPPVPGHRQPDTSQIAPSLLPSSVGQRVFTPQPPTYREQTGHLGLTAEQLERLRRAVVPQLPAHAQPARVPSMGQLGAAAQRPSEAQAPRMTQVPGFTPHAPGTPMGLPGATAQVHARSEPAQSTNVQPTPARPMGPPAVPTQAPTQGHMPVPQSNQATQLMPVQGPTAEEMKAKSSFMYEFFTKPE